MAADQRNYDNWLYTDDNGVDWTKRGEKETVRQAVDGSAATTSAPVWLDSPRMAVRHIIYRDSTTGRTKRVIFYTTTAFNAVALGDVIAFPVEGEATAVNYAADRKVAEKQPRRGGIIGLPDHA